MKYSSDDKNTGNLSLADLQSLVKTVQRRLALFSIGRSLLVSISIFVIVVALSGFSAWSLLFAAFVSAVVFLFLWKRSEPVTPVRAALWLEERQPANHALVSLVESGYGHGISNWSRDALVKQTLASYVSIRSSYVHSIKSAAARYLFAPSVLLFVCLLVFFIASIVRSESTSFAVGTEGLVQSTGKGEDAQFSGARLNPWTVVIVPPAYTRAPSKTYDNFSNVEAIEGSVVRVSGSGSSSDLRASLLRRDGDNNAEIDIQIPQNNLNWSVESKLLTEPSALRLTSKSETRLLSLVPVRDSVPLVLLQLPLRDTVYRDTTGVLKLAAEAQDDIGLLWAEFEVIVTRGSGEQYTARTISAGRRSANGARKISIENSINFDELGVGPGDVLHARAVALDANPASNRAKGISETRSIRFARSDEYDSVSVDAAPPPEVDSSLLSQRMLLDMTEKLEVRRPRMRRDSLVAESRRLALEQARIRRAVSAVVFQRFSGEGESEHVHYEGDGHDHGLSLQEGRLVPSFGAGTVAAMPGAEPPPGMSVRQNNNMTEESPILAVNRPLLEAYNAMWDAGRALELADPTSAIPAMKIALEAIQRARNAERVYLRGRARAVVVDIARVRMAGRDTGNNSRRLAGEPIQSSRQEYSSRLMSAVMSLADNSNSARDSLVVLRLDAVRDMPDFANALQAVLDEMDRGSDLTSGLIRARRLLDRPSSRQGISSWSVP